jgi:uncharacterized protein
METKNIGVQFFLMTNKPGAARKVSRSTWIGLFLALFAMVAIRYVVMSFAYEITFGWAIVKETLMWVSAAVFLIIVRRGERLPFSSIGLGTRHWWKSILLGLVIAVVLALVVGGLAYLTGWRHGPGSAVSDRLPLWLILVIVFRAGVVEELFYRGYAIEHLRMVGFGQVWSITIPLVIFSLAHWSGGAANSLIALAAGAVLTGFYLWRRDLVANVISHCLVSLL